MRHCPVFAMAQLNLQRYGQFCGPFHFFSYNKPDLLQLVTWQLKQKFIMHLKYHPRLDGFFP